MNVIIIGPYPPPYGGISVHVKRMKQYLESKNINIVLYNESKEFKDISKNIIPVNGYKKFIFKIPFLKGDVLHFHSIDKRIRILLGFYKIFNKNIILSIHGESVHDQIKTSNLIGKKLLNFSLKKIDFITCSNSKIKKDLVEFGINHNKIEVVPEYIKPIKAEEDEKSIPEYVWEFIKKSEFLISTNGWIRFYNNEDLYGIDMLIELLNDLHKKNIKARLLVALLGVESQNQKEKNYYEDLKKKIIKLNLQNDILIFESKNKEFYPILSKTQLFMRPTNTDGNSVSVMEALDCKIPCITSDACPRPNGVVLFKTRDINDLVNKTTDLIENYKLYKEKANEVILENNAEKLLKIYKRIAKN